MKTIMVVPRWFPITEATVRKLAEFKGLWDEFGAATIQPTTLNLSLSLTGAQLLKSICILSDGVIDQTNWYYVNMKRKWFATGYYNEKDLIREAILPPTDLYFPDVRTPFNSDAIKDIDTQIFAKESKRLLENVEKSPFNVDVQTEVIPGEPYTWRANISIKQPKLSFDVKVTRANDGYASGVIMDEILKAKENERNGKT